MPDENQGVSFPEDVTSLSDAELANLRDSAVAQFQSLSGGEVTEATMEVLRPLAAGIKTVRKTIETRAVAAAKLAAEHASMTELVDGVAAEMASKEHVDEEDGKEKEAVTADAVPQGGATTKPREKGTRGLNVPLSEVAIRQPASATGRVIGQRRESVLVASADIPDYGVGAKLDDMETLVAAMQSRARGLPILRRGDDTTRYPIASLQRSFKHTLGPNATPDQIDQVMKDVTDVDSLVAAGGWCSPSEISYDFYNIVAVDGILDLPTVGINRGGMRWPISPSFGDLVGNAAMWSWSETQDIAAVTGTAQSGTKTCARVPCPSFNEARLGCDGLCLTVGNLTEDAYPELIANHTRLLFAAHAHKMNAKRILQLYTNSATVTGTFGSAGSGVVSPVLGALELSAIDYREKYAMADGAVLEVVLPRWLRAMMRSDLRKRTRENTSMLSMTDAALMALFDAIGIRVQWVGDWQTRASGYFGTSTVLTAWPTTVQFMMYSPGTWVMGQGLRLDLGIIRDSILNATNDHTAEWMEECWLIAQIGHESRRGIINICPDGTVGAADLTACDV
jgi:hypothetical protein